MAVNAKGEVIVKSTYKHVDGKLVRACYNANGDQIDCDIEATRQGPIEAPSLCKSGVGDWRNKLPAAWKQGLNKFSERHLKENTVNKIGGVTEI